MLRTGTVTDSTGGMLTILFERPEACKECGACGGSRHGHLTVLKGTGAVGDLVTVDMPEGSVVSASAMAYAIPLVFMLGGLFAGAPLAARLASGLSNDLASAIGALVGLLVSLPLLKRVDRTIRGSKRWTPQLIAIAPQSKSGQEVDRNA